MNVIIRNLACAAVIASSLSLGSPVDLRAPDQEPRPVLGGHRFIWNPFTRSPYPRTMVRSHTGGGKFTNVEFVPAFELGEDITVEAVKGDLLFAELEFEYMHQIQPWLGMWGNVGALARLGTDTGALLAEDGVLEPGVVGPVDARPALLPAAEHVLGHVGLNDAEHDVDKTKRGPVDGGTSSGKGKGGDRVWKDSLLPNEKKALKKFFE